MEEYEVVGQQVAVSVAAEEEVHINIKLRSCLFNLRSLCVLNKLI